MEDLEEIENAFREIQREKEFECSECDKKFTAKSSLNVHKRLHLKEKPFSCSFCDRRFNQSHHVVSHERTHTGEKPFNCSKCEKTFADKTTLTKHERLHKKPTVNEFTCLQCDKTFAWADQLAKHEKSIHVEVAPLNCSVCDKNPFHFPRPIFGHDQN